jgi:hypothetical protein
MGAVGLWPLTYASQTSQMPPVVILLASMIGC